MKKWGKGRLSHIFKTLAAASALVLASGCTTTKWAGEPGHGEDRIDEPLLEYTSIRPDRVIMEDAPQTITRGSTLIKIDDILHWDDDYSVRSIEFEGHMGTRETAYLTVPDEGGPHPLVVVFPILNDDGSVSEVVSKSLARRGFAVLRMQGYPLDLADASSVEELMDKFRYSITDARALARYVQGLPEIDAERFAVAGVSLGSLLSATMMGVDEDVDAGAFILSGGGLSEILYDSQEDSVEAFRNYLISAGLISSGGGLPLIGGGVAVEGFNEFLQDVETGSLESFRINFMERYQIETREDFIRLTRPYTLPLDPSRYAGSLDPCRTMIVSGRGDQIMPRERTEELWERLGRPDWHEVPGGHRPIVSFYWIMDKMADHIDDVLNGGRCDNRNLPSEAANDDTLGAANDSKIDAANDNQAPQEKAPAAIAMPKLKMR